MSIQFISTNKNYKRLFDAPLDPTVSWDTIEELNNYINSDPTSYKNQIIGSEGKVFIVCDENGTKKANSITQNKFDDVILTEEGMLNFYADKVLVKSIQLPTKFARAICGEFLCGELNVGEGIQSYSYEKTIWEDGITPVNAFNMNKIEDKLTTLEGYLTKFYHIAPTPPEDTNLIWIDTTDENIDTTINSSILDEMRAAMSAMQNKINKLEADVEYLKINGGGGIPPVVSDYSLLTEDGDMFIAENGEVIVLEEYQEIVAGDFVITEEGNIFIVESGDNLILEGGII